MSSVLTLDPLAAERLRPAQGVAEVDWSTGELSGWLLLPDLEWTSVEVHAGSAVAAAGPEPSPELAAMFPHVPHARQCAFRVRLSPNQLQALQGRGASRCLVVGCQGDRPVARVRTLLFPDYLVPDIPTPPAELIARTQGNEDRRSYQRLGYRYYRQLLEAIERHRASGGGRRLLDFGCGCGRVAANFLADPSGFQVTGCDLDPEAIAFCQAHLPTGQFDLVPALPLPYGDAAFDLAICLAVSPAFGPDEQQAVLGELHRVIAPGGLLLISVQGPLAASCFYPPDAFPDFFEGGIFDHCRYEALDPRIDKGPYRGVFQTPEYTRREWSRYFEVLEYAEGEINADHDLVVLRRPGAAAWTFFEWGQGNGAAAPAAASAESAPPSPVDDLYPPDEMDFVGGGGFKENGDWYLRYFIDLAGLKPHERVLDVGCGIGRMAIPLTQYLSAEGSYEGFDIVKMGIDWCRTKITPRYPNFHFQLADVYNKSYLPEGRYRDSEYTFPYPDESFDFVFLTSVFTHMLPAGLKNYLYEIARVLKKGGRCLITYFLLNDESRALLEGGRGLIKFPYQFPRYSLARVEIPEDAVALDESFIRSLYRRFGLSIQEPIEYRSWCGRPGHEDVQDLVVARKIRDVPRKVAAAHQLTRALVTLRRVLGPNVRQATSPDAGAAAHIRNYLQSKKANPVNSPPPPPCPPAVSGGQAEGPPAAPEAPPAPPPPAPAREAGVVPETAAFSVLRALIPELAPRPAQFPAAIHQEDEMFLFTLTHSEEDRLRSVISYFVIGRRIFDAIRQPVAWHFGGFESVGSFLDFACGYGRCTRFLLQELPPERVWGCDIYAGAVAFQRDEFGIHGVVSTRDPAALPLAEESFDCILALSFFTHMPEAAFTRWLDRLYRLLKPGGALIFSTTDVSVLPPEDPGRRSTFHFIPHSESRSLDTEEYGTSYVTEAYVAEAIARLSPGAGRYQRVPRALNHQQDLYLLPRGPAPRRPPLDFVYPPVGDVDMVEYPPTGALCLTGWAFDPNPGREVEVQVSVNGQVLRTCVPDRERTDVREHFQDPSVLRSGWYCQLEPGEWSARHPVIVRAVNRRGAHSVFWATVPRARGRGGVQAAGVDSGLPSRASAHPDKLPLPPERMVVITGHPNLPAFEQAARGVAHQCQVWGNLQPDGRVLDVGCGIGRLAIGLAGYLRDAGAYEGIDVIGEMIEWCRQNISRIRPNFRFRHADVYNGFYNPHGRQQAATYRFPYADESFDLVFLGSLFTHLLPAEVENYLAEIGRVLKPGGRCLISYFLLDGGVLKNPEGKADWLRFEHEGPGYRTNNPQRPEDAIAYEEGYLRQLYSRCGLTVVEPVYYGGQDVVVAVKGERPGGTDLRELQRHWDELGKRDPLWAILSDPAKINNQWDLGEFFQTGEDQAAAIMKLLDALRPPVGRERCLDFGCGVGRVTQALCRYFAECHGVDLSPSMIRRARQYNRHGDRCHYHPNAADDLRLFGDNFFDFVFTFQVMQHMRPEYGRAYVREFLRVLKPGGVLYLQIPSGRVERPPPGPDALTEPLPDEAFRARLRPHLNSLTAPPACPVTLRVRVTNASPVFWPPARVGPGCLPVMLRNHWLDAAGNLLVEDDGTTGLPNGLGPGEEVDLPLTIHTPAQVGSYILEFDLVQEFVAWFKNKGSQAVRIPVRVESGIPSPAADVPNPGTDGFTPRIEMHPIPRAEVQALLARAGGEVVNVAEGLDQDWISVTYLVRKR